jgi:hypothetical protein
MTAKLRERRIVLMKLICTFSVNPKNLSNSHPEVSALY